MILDVSDSGFQKINAYWMAWVGMQAYQGFLFRPKKLTDAGFSRVHYFSEKSSSLGGFIAENEETVVISFAGTANMSDLIHDFTFSLKSDKKFDIPGKLHEGFLTSVDKAWPEIYNTVAEYSDHGRKKIFISGHSLGAAISAITAARLMSLGYEVEGAYLFSIPRIGNREFADWFNQKLNNRVFRFVNNEDIVPRLPPSAAAATEFSEMFSEPVKSFMKHTFSSGNYTHVGQLITFNAAGKMSEPTEFEESEDTKYWTKVIDRSRGTRPGNWLMANWRMLADHMPETNYCYVKLNKADQ